MTTGRSRIVGYAFLLIWAGFAIHLYWGTWAIDLAAVYFSAHFHGQGLPDLIYSPLPEFFWTEPPDAWQQLALASGGKAHEVTPYVYPPLWAMLLSPLATWLSATQFFKLALVLNVAGFVAMVALAHRLIGAGRVSFALWSALSVLLLTLSQIAHISLALGQPQILVSLITLAAFTALVRGRDLTAGGLLGLAAAIKLSPALLAIVLVMERRWKALGAFLATGAGLAAVSVASAGWEMHAALLQRIRQLDGLVVVSRLNYALEQVLYQIGKAFHGGGGVAVDRPEYVPEPGWVGPVVTLVLLGLLVWSYLATRPLAGDRRIWARLMLVYLVVFLTAPLSWVHYLILPMMLMPGFLGFFSQRSALAILIAFTAGTSAHLFLFLARLREGGAYQLAIGTGLVLAVMLLILLRAAKTRSGPSPASADMLTSSDTQTQDRPAR